MDSSGLPWSAMWEGHDGHMVATPTLSAGPTDPIHLSPSPLNQDEESCHGHTRTARPAGEHGGTGHHHHAARPRRPVTATISVMMSE